MQHDAKPGFAKNTRYATKFFNYEVKCTWISSFLNPQSIIIICSFIKILYKKLLN